jgi:hypothetical protein
VNKQSAFNTIVVLSKLLDDNHNISLKKVWYIKLILLTFMIFWLKWICSVWQGLTHLLSFSQIFSVAIETISGDDVKAQVMWICHWLIFLLIWWCKCLARSPVYVALESNVGNIQWGNLLNYSGPPNKVKYPKT